MATGSPVSFWYGTRAQFDSITTKLDTTLYFITDEQALYKGSVKFSGSGVDTLLTISSTQPSASSVTTGDKYFNTSDNLIHVLKNENGTVTTTATYEPANGALYYNADAQRFQTLVKNGSSYVPTEIYDAGISVEDGTGLVLNGTTVGGLDATTNSKGVVQVGSNLNVSDGVVSVPTATNARFGVVKSGDNITNTNGVISVAKATTSSLGVVKVGSNINVDANGSISVDTASTSTPGIVQLVNEAASSDMGSETKAITPHAVSQVATSLNNEINTKQNKLSVSSPLNISGDNLSVNDATTLDPGVVQLVNDAGSSDMGSQTKAITPHAVGQVADGLNQEINTKQDNLSNGNVTTINTTSGAKIDVNVGDGLDVGVAGSTNANKLIVNEASVKEVLEDVVDGGTEPAVNEIVTADNLKGALSVGQAVDVSCLFAAWGCDFDKISFDGGGSWTDVSTSSFAELGNEFINGFILEKTDVTANTSYSFGWVYSQFPKYAPGLRYLILFDARVLSDYDVDIYGTSRSPDIHGYGGRTVVHGASTYERFAFSSTSDKPYYRAKSATASTIRIEFKNWRQYEVTALTDEAIAYIAQLEDPDAFFRSTDTYSILDKYLIKQDMVCPWIPTINMPDNSDLTVAAGLSYKIKYTNDNTHTITADTIHSDAYGWDTHIQMFIKGTSAINFQAPLVLMDALTPNAGHNLVVKWRNGDAFVYVDDLNAGNIVISTSGTTAGTLNYFLQQDPGSGQDNYIIFAETTDGNTCDAGTVTVNYNTDILGNGTDNTIITGNISVTSGNTINFQSLTIDGSTITGIASGTIYLTNVGLSDTHLNAVRCYPSSITLRGGTVSTDWNFQLRNSVNIDGEGVLDMRGHTLVPGTNSTIYISGITIKNGSIDGYGKTSLYISGCTFTNAYSLYASILNEQNDNSHIIFDNCLISGNTSGTAAIVCSKGTTEILNSTMTNNAGTFGSGIQLTGTGNMLVENCTITNNTGTYNGFYCAGNKTGVLTIKNCTVGGVGTLEGQTLILDGTITYINGKIIAPGVAASPVIIIRKNTILDLTGNATMEINTGVGRIEVEDNITIKTEQETHKLDACVLLRTGTTVSCIYATGKLMYDVLNISPSANSTWQASNITFTNPVNATEANTIKLSGTTFTTKAKTLNANRIQLPASTTVSFQGNTNDADTKILDASLIVVGDNPASPSGSATVVNASGTSSTVTGIGTYIDKEGDNDFVANNTTNVVAVDGSTAGAKYLGTVLSATTGDTGANRFAKIDSGAVAVVNEATNAVNKQILTHDYEPIIGGTFSLTSATVDEATKTVAIQSGGTMSVVDIRGGKDSVIDLGGKQLYCSGNISAFVQGCTLSGGNTTAYGGCLRADNGAHVTISSALITGNRTTYSNRGTICADLGGVVTLRDSEITANPAGAAIIRFNGTLNMSGCHSYNNKYNESTEYYLNISGTGKLNLENSIIGDKIMFCDSSYTGTCTLTGSNAVNVISSYNGGSGTVTITSGAVLDLTGNTNATPIAPGGGITFEQGGATVLYSSGAVSGSYMMDNATLPAGAKLTNTAVVELGGLVNGSCKGSLSGVTITSGRINFHSGAMVASDTTLNNGGQLMVWRNTGSAVNTTVNSGGYLYINSDGVASSVTNNNGGNTYVYFGGVATDVIVNGGWVYAIASGTKGGGTINNAIVNGGRLRIDSGGVANEPIISSGGSLIVSSGGTALLVTSQTGASVTVAEGGVITYK